MRRSQRSGVEDRWHLSRTKKGTPCLKHGKGLFCSAKHGTGMRWAARYVSPHGDEVTKHFPTKAEAQAWLDAQTDSMATGTYVSPQAAGVTVEMWTEIWLKAYAVHRASTVRQAKTHVKRINRDLGQMLLNDIKPSTIKTWIAQLQEDYTQSTVHALYSRLNHVLRDAVEDGYLGRNPCSRRTSPATGRVERFCPTTEQVWELYELMPEHLRPAILLGAFAGLRVAEATALRVEDVDFMRGIAYPKVQWSGKSPCMPLKTKGSSAPIPIPQELVLMLSAALQSFPGPTLVTNGTGQSVGPWIVERAIAKVRKEHKLDPNLEFHCLRHYLASVLISQGCDVKTVQARMRHSSARTTLDVYGHMWPDKDETTRSAIGSLIAARVARGDSPARSVRALPS